MFPAITGKAEIRLRKDRRVYDARLHVKLLAGFVKEKFMCSSEVKSFVSLQDLLVLEHLALYFLRSFVFNI